MKNLPLIALALVALLHSCNSVVHTPQMPHPQRFEQEAFANPEKSYRAVPFYSLNDKLEAEELTRQLGLIQEAGYGGAFLHSRTGLLTPYLSPEWFEMMEVGTEACQRLGIDAWYYDEDKWPSGFAGGIVPLQSDSFRSRTLLRQRLGTPVAEGDSILWSDERYQYLCAVDPMGQSWYNGTSWVDLMNPEMVQAFIDCSYTPYVERFSGRPNVMGIFTDEPQISPRSALPNEGMASYSPALEECFKLNYGAELAPSLPALFDTVGNWRAVRLAYYRSVGDCMESAFSEKIGTYCRENNLIWTGHFTAEESTIGSMTNEGNLLQQMRHMGQPGIDALGLRYNTLYCGKSVNSVANQYAIARRLSELFGIAGHNLSFEDRMWIASWHTLMGVNAMCPHLYLYSMKGVRKRDYPPAISHQQPYWGENHLFEEYSARLCYFATAGQNTAEVCVIYPLESTYIELALGTAQKRTDEYEQLLHLLMNAHRNFDMGDELIISQIGEVKGGRFVVGEMAYKLVILPCLLTIRASTLDLLEQFTQQGGTLIVAGDYPTLVDGAEDAEAQRALSQLKTYSTQIDPTVVGEEAFTELIATTCDPLFSLQGENTAQVWSHLRSVQGGHTLQLSNTSRLEEATLTISWADPNTPVALWNPINGEALALSPNASGSYTLHFAPAQTWILSTDRAANVQFDGSYFPPQEREAVRTLQGTWSNERLDPNAITLDFARFSRDGGATWSEAEPVLAFTDRCASQEPYNGALLVRYEVEIEQCPTLCSLVVEQPELCKAITVNGQAVDFSQSGSYRDASFRTQQITSLLSKGTNEITLSLDFVSATPTSLNAQTRYGTEIESIYLIGDFGVAGKKAKHPLTSTWRNLDKKLKPTPVVNSLQSFTLTAEATQAQGDLTLGGYPFYAGAMTLTQHFQIDSLRSDGRYLLQIPNPQSILVGVELNGVSFPTLLCAPWECEITSALQVGENTLTLTLTNGLRNLLGPHHNKGGELSQVGPSSFRGNGSWPDSNFEQGEANPNWYDVRREGNPTIWRDDYYVIPFGLIDPPTIYYETQPLK